MMALGVVTHCTVRTGDDAFTATGTTRFIDTHDAGNRILEYCFRIHRAGAQAGRTFAVLAGQRQEGEACLFQRARPHHLVAIFTGTEAVFGLARRLAAFAASAALQIDQQRNAFGRSRIYAVHVSLPMPANATR